MPKSLQLDSTAILVIRAYSLHQQIADLEGERDRVEKELIRRGKGKHPGGEGQEITVIVPEPGKPSYKLSKENEEKAREIVGDLDHFKALFNRQVFYKPCEGFANVAMGLLKKRTCNRLLKLCRLPVKKQAPYLKYAK